MLLVSYIIVFIIFEKENKKIIILFSLNIGKDITFFSFEFWGWTINVYHERPYRYIARPRPSYSCSTSAATRRAKPARYIRRRDHPYRPWPSFRTSRDGTFSCAAQNARQTSRRALHIWHGSRFPASYIAGDCRRYKVWCTAWSRSTFIRGDDPFFPRTVIIIDGRSGKGRNVRALWSYILYM